MLQDETCPKCGQPIWLCRSDSNNVAFKVQSDTCFAEKAMKSFEEGRKDKKDQKATAKEKRDWGKFWYTVPYVPPTADGDLPTRNDYYQGLQNSK